MKAKKLVTLAVPFMLLVGCGTEKTEAKPKEIVKDGNKIDASQFKVAVDYKVESFKDGSFKMTDTKGNSLQAVKRK
jgi:hypothetical protein